VLLAQSLQPSVVYVYQYQKRFAHQNNKELK
jgi:hypothetical protein